MFLLKKELKDLLKAIYPRKLGSQIALYVSILLALSMAIFSWHAIDEQVDNVKSNMQMQAEVLANNIASVSATHLLTRNYSSIEQLLLQAIDFPSVYKIQLSNGAGKLLGREA